MRISSSNGEETLTILKVITIFFYYFIEQFILSLPDLYSVVSNILGLVSPESYRVSYPVTAGKGECLVLQKPIIVNLASVLHSETSQY